MTGIQERCEDLSRKLVKRDGHCELCGLTQGIEAHHPFGKKCNPIIVYDPRLGVCLCKFCHPQYGQENLAGLLAELGPILLVKDPERLSLLERTAATYKQHDTRKTDWPAILASLKQFERDHSDGWMDADIVPEYGKLTI